MKNVLFVVLTIFVVILLSCSKDEQSKNTYKNFESENLHDDLAFQKYLLDFQVQASKLNDEEKLRRYISDGKLDQSEIENFPKLFGYIDSKKYWEERKEINDIRLTLINNYNLVDVSVEQIKEEVLKAFETSPQLYSFEVGLMDEIDEFDDECERIRRNCLLSVASEAAIMHTTCLSLDLSLIAGALCHGAAVLYQWTAGNNCNEEAARCRAGKKG